MSKDPAQPGEGADDLFGRWLAHREKPDTAEEASTPVDPASPPKEAAAPLRRESTPVAKSSTPDTVDRRDGLGPVVAPSAFGVRRGLPGTAFSGPTGSPSRSDDVAELDRPSPVGFEPIVIASLRNKEQAKDKSKDKVKERDKRGRLARLKSRVVDDVAPPTTSKAASSHVEAPPTKLPPPPVFPNAVPKAPSRPVAAPARKIVPYEDMIALAMGSALPADMAGTKDEAAPAAAAPSSAESTEAKPKVEEQPKAEAKPKAKPKTEAKAKPKPKTETEAKAKPKTEAEAPPKVEAKPKTEAKAPPKVEAKPAPKPEPRTQPAPAIPEARVEPAPQVVSAPKAEPITKVEPAKGEPTTAPRRLVARKKPAPDTTSTESGKTTKKRPASSRTTQDDSRSAAMSAVEPEPKPGFAAPNNSEPSSPAPKAPVVSMPAVYEFAPIKGARRLLSLLLIAALILTGYFGLAAYSSQAKLDIQLAAVAAVVTFIIWAARAGGSLTKMVLKSGQLEINRQGTRMVFDLASQFTPIEVHGRPSSRRWKVLFLRRGVSPVAIDRSMVDAEDFMRVLTFYRPDLAPDASAAQLETTVGR